MRKQYNIFIVACSFLVGCSGLKYPNWEYVRIERSVPTEKCIYMVQESCPPIALEGCLNWYKKRATKYNANTVVIDDSRLANYYSCPSSKPMGTNE